MDHRACHVCSGQASVIEPALYGFPNITSDCRPWPAGRAVALCDGCGLMQRSLLPEAVEAMGQVYADYAMFKHSSTASDQLSFGIQGIPQGRTEKILRFIQDKLAHLPASVLDVGSGSGAGLVALGNAFQAARIYGFEPNDKPAERQRSLPGNVVSVSGTFPDNGEKYDLVTLFHVLEHVEDLFGVLKSIASVLTPQGNILIQVPYSPRAPFDYVISDHIWHFSKTSLSLLLQKANFSISYIGNELIDKELTLLASVGKDNRRQSYPGERQESIESMAWLCRYKYFLDSVKNAFASVAIFGTGPSGAWAGQVLGDCVVAYIDDDPARIDSIFNGKPVLSPQAIERGLPVVAPFPDYQFKWVAEKNKNLNILDPAADYAAAPPNPKIVQK